METVAIILGIALAVCIAVIAWLVINRTRSAGDLARFKAEAEQARRDTDHAQQRRAEETSALKEIQATLRTDLDAAENAAKEFEIKLSREQEQRDSDRKLHAQREAQLQQEQTNLQNWLREQEENLKAQFEKLSMQALDQSSKRFLEQAKLTFDHQVKQAGGDLDLRKKAVADLVAPIGETLEKTQERLAKLGERVELTTAASENLRLSTDKLVQAFSKPEIRGRYGEIQLRRVAELAGMLPYCDFDEQSTTRDDEGRALRPDMVVKMPGDRVVVVDAKCNIDSFVRATEVIEADERERLLEKFASDVAGQVTKLSKKSYWQQYESSADFVVMFVPGAQFLETALARRPELMEQAADQNVILASPATLIGLLRAVAVGWRDNALTEQARELFELGKELHERASVAFAHIEDVGSALDRATRKYNDAVGSIQSRLMPTLRRFEESGAKSAKTLPPMTSEISVIPRQGILRRPPDAAPKNDSSNPELP